MELKEIQSIIEAILFAAGEPVPISRIAAAIEITDDDVEKAAVALSDYYSFNRCGISIVKIDNKLQLCSRAEFAPYIRKVLEVRKPPSLSHASLEVLAIIAYKQPVTRAYIEQIRGVDSSGTVTSLAEKGLIEECGKLDVPGRPALFRTTDNFLRSFGIEKLSQLPQIETEGDGQLTFPADIQKDE